MARRYSEPRDREAVVVYKGHQVFGEMLGKTFQKFVERKKHFLRIRRGWAFDADVIDRIGRDYQPDTLRVVVKDDGKEYTVSWTTFMEKREAIDLGYGRQYVLAEKHFTLQVLLAVVGAKEPDIDWNASSFDQLSLF